MAPSVFYLSTGAFVNRMLRERFYYRHWRYAHAVTRFRLW